MRIEVKRKPKKKRIRDTSNKVFVGNKNYEHYLEWRNDIGISFEDLTSHLPCRKSRYRRKINAYTIYPVTYVSTMFSTCESQELGSMMKEFVYLIEVNTHW